MAADESPSVRVPIDLRSRPRWSVGRIPVADRKTLLSPSRRTRGEEEEDGGRY